MASNSTKPSAEITESAPEEIPGPVVDESTSSEPVVNNETAEKTEPVKEVESADKDVTDVKDSKKVEFDAQAELASLEQQVGSLSHKQSVAIITFENNLNRARKFIAEGDEQLASLAEALKSKLQEILSRNQEHQQALLEQSKEFITKLEKALEDGQSHDALSTWDKIQSNFNNTTGDIKKSLQPFLLPFKGKIAELRDWKAFAATEKKKELIEQMKSLADSELNPGEKSKHISKMHRDWKTLGRSNQNEELWLEFKQASDKASEPCKEYFKQRKQQMAANLQARQTLCDELERDLQEIKLKVKDEPPLLSQLNKLLKQADDTWKKHAPIDHSKIKTLQKRYYDVVNELRKMRKTLVKNSAQTKKDLIARASALLEGDDPQQAMSQAKQLQQEWKQAGPGAYKDDKQLWEKFRGVCDQIFSTRGSGSNSAHKSDKTEHKSRLDEAHKQLQPLLKELETLLTAPEEALRDQRKQYQSLQQSFSAALEQLPGKQRGKFRDQFNGIKRKLDTRYRALPDKKSQALLDRVQACAAYLQEFESALAANDNDVQQAFDQNHWQTLIAEISGGHQSSLQQRADALLKPGQKKETKKEATKAAEDARAAFRKLCIAAEIRADVESPEEDQGVRMELQLAQLKTGFGQGKKQQEKHADFIVDCRLESLCLGPLQADERQQFQDRLEKSLQRLF